MRSLRWSRSRDGLEFSFVADGTRVGSADWSKVDDPQSRAGIGVLLGLAESGKATQKVETVHVGWDALASLTDRDAETVGLPRSVPFALDLRCDGTLDQSTCRFQVSWVDVGAKPVIGAVREGCLLARGSNEYRIPQPLYAIVKEAHAFNTAPPTTMEDRFLAWARIREQISGSAQAHPSRYLESIRVFRPQAFTLHLDDDGNGSIRARPVPLKVSQRGDDESLFAQAGIASELLPPVLLSKFTERFGQFDASTRYALDEGQYVVVDEPLRRAFAVVKEMQAADPATRRAFARNPRAALRDRLDGAVSDEELESLFQETEGYSDRVKGLGLWKPPSIPWMTSSGREWVPPEYLTEDANSELFETRKLEELVNALEAAIKNGETSVLFDGKAVAANQETLTEARQGLDARVATSKPTGEPQSREKAPTYALEITRNLEELGYEAQTSQRQCGPKTTPPCSTRLKEHQESGLRWLQERWSSGAPGALLADDMGLGKTLQALLFLAWLEEEMAAGRTERKPILVVAPTGLLKNWQDEMNHHLGTNGLGPPLSAYGADLRSLKTGPTSLDRDRVRSAAWVLTTYETLRDYHTEFGKVAFGVIVFDEIQKIKNPSILLTEAAKAMRKEFVVALTGTPVENRLTDLWSIGDAVHPGFLGELRSFVRRYDSDSVDEAALRELKHKTFEEPKNAPLILRRMKGSELKGLPNKHTHVLETTMPDKQATQYEHCLRAPTLLQALLGIRQASLHPAIEDIVPDDELIEESARFSALFKALDDVRSKRERALVFLEYHKVQEILAGLIQRRYSLPSKPLVISGLDAGARRKSKVDDFQQRRGFDVMILSPKAGGVGLTLTSANHVIHLNRWWNPAVEDQCTDRVYRIGQEKAVHVYYPVAVHPELGKKSFDWQLNELLERKRRLSSELLVPPGFTKKDMEDLSQSTGVRADKSAAADSPVSDEEISAAGAMDDSYAAGA